MKRYVLRRTDQGGGYVAKEGGSESYTQELARIRKFKTLEEASENRCIVNEVIEELMDEGLQGILF